MTTATTRGAVTMAAAGMTDHPVIGREVAGVDGTRGRRVIERLRLLLLGVRTRILAWYVVLVALAVLGSLVAERKILTARLDSLLEQDLNQEYEELRQLVGGRNEQTGECWRSLDPVTAECPVGRDPETGQVFGNDVARIFDVFLQRNIPSENEAIYTFVGGAPHRANPERAPYDLLQDPQWTSIVASVRVPLRGEHLTPEGPVEYLAVPLVADGLNQDPGPLGVFVVAQFRDAVARSLTDVMGVAAFVGIGMLLLASLLAWAVAGRILKPIRLVTETARDISETDLSRRIEVEQTNDEVSTLARTFNGMLDRIEEAFDVQRQFVDDAGHELRTPITIIRGHLELLSAEDDPRELRQTVDLVTDELDRMARMVQDLLVLAKLQRPDFLDLETVDLGALTKELCVKASALGVREWVVDDVGAGRIVADRQRLTQAMMQLAQNATQHTEEGSAIGLGSALADGYALLWVRDAGPGIAEEDHERIFERFARARASRRRSQGAGLGLSIVRAIAEAHQGRVEVSSESGKGAMFTIVMPTERLGAEVPHPGARSAQRDPFPEGSP
ncbi:MAG: sensor histidine kinase [Egibacteraceae bacterium]